MDQIYIVAIIAVAIVIVLIVIAYIFRDRLSKGSFKFRLGKTSIEGNLAARPKQPGEGGKTSAGQPSDITSRTTTRSPQVEDTSVVANSEINMDHGTVRKSKVWFGSKINIGTKSASSGKPSQKESSDDHH